MRSVLLTDLDTWGCVYSTEDFSATCGNCSFTCIPSSSGSESLLVEKEEDYLGVHNALDHKKKRDITKKSPQSLKEGSCSA